MTRLEFISLAPGRRKDIIEFVKALKRYGFISSEEELLSRIKISERVVMPMLFQRAAELRSMFTHGVEPKRYLRGFTIVIDGHYPERHGSWDRLHACENNELKRQFGPHDRPIRLEPRRKHPEMPDT
jgi:hypothetical protein